MIGRMDHYDFAVVQIKVGG